MEAIVKQALVGWEKKPPSAHPISEATAQHMYPPDHVQADWLLPLYRQPRFERATADPTKQSVLYRPEVVNDFDLFDFVQNCPNNGVMVRGPQGIGKSFTLLNLYRRLVGEGHLVAFLPQTVLATTNQMYFQAIAQALGVGNMDVDVSDDDKITKCIKQVAANYLPHDKNLYFIFDQINEVFYPTPTRKLSQLKSPHNLMNSLRTIGGIPIISASANNSSAYRDNHEGFKAWDHPTLMNHTELQALYPNFALDDDTYYLTGNIPLQVDEYEEAESPELYEKQY